MKNKMRKKNNVHLLLKCNSANGRGNVCICGCFEGHIFEHEWRGLVRPLEKMIEWDTKIDSPIFLVLLLHDFEIAHLSKVGHILGWIERII